MGLVSSQIYLSFIMAEVRQQRMVKACVVKAARLPWQSGLQSSSQGSDGGCRWLNMQE
jgi:hypothetical protein